MSAAPRSPVCLPTLTQGYHLTSWQSWNALWIYVQVFIALRVVPYEELTALTAVKPPCWDSLLLLGLTLTSCPQMPLEERIIFSGNLFQYQEDNKKWRNRFSLVPHNYGLVLYENHVVSALCLAASHPPLHFPGSYSVTPQTRSRLHSPCCPPSHLPPSFSPPNSQAQSNIYESSPLLQTCLSLGPFLSMSFHPLSRCPCPCCKLSFTRKPYRIPPSPAEPALSEWPLAGQSAPVCHSLHGLLHSPCPVLLALMWV